MKPRVIAIDDDEMFLTATKSLFTDNQVPLATYTNSNKAIRAIEDAMAEKSPFRMAIVDYDMPIKGHEVVRSIKQVDPSIHTVVLSAYLSEEESKLCTLAGADHIYLKQKSKEVILMISEVASLKIKRGKLTNEEKLFNEDWIKQVLDLNGRSSGLAKVANEVKRYAQANESVLITGQSGVGKEKVALSLHTNSKRRGEFIKVNCGSIAKGLLESELFGHKKGAFTGAINQKPGLFAAANFGTIFLDEIGEMPLNMQVSLLRVLQEKEIVPVGGSTPIKLDIRVVAATNRNLSEEVRKGNFREDLYYRLNILPINVPPLSERKDDIEPICEVIISRKNKELGLNKSLTPGAMAMLSNYAWPGNIRELEAKIVKAYMSAREKIDRSLFPDQLSYGEDESLLNQITRVEDFPAHDEFLDKVINHLMRTYLEKALVLTNGNRAEAAKLTKLPYTTYIHKRKKLGLTSWSNHSKEGE